MLYRIKSTQIADLLSYTIWVGKEILNFKSSKILLIHIALVIPWANALNSASADDQDTTPCFLFWWSYYLQRMHKSSLLACDQPKNLHNQSQSRSQGLVCYSF